MPKEGDVQSKYVNASCLSMALIYNYKSSTKSLGGLPRVSLGAGSAFETDVLLQKPERRPEKGQHL
jgi:hypothetical protein